MAKMAKKANFGPILAVYVPKILIFMGIRKSFGTHITEKPPRQLVRMVFWSGIRSNEPKNADIWPKMSKIPFLGGWSKTFGTLISGNQ